MSFIHLALNTIFVFSDQYPHNIDETEREKLKSKTDL